MNRIALASLFTLLAGAVASAQPVKCVDAKGKTRYIDATMAAQEKCEPVRDSTSTVKPQAQPPGSARTGSSPGNPRAEIEERIAAAETRLAEAQKNLADQEAIRSGNERNYARVLERLKPYQDAVDRAQQELDQVRRDSR